MIILQLNYLLLLYYRFEQFHEDQIIRNLKNATDLDKANFLVVMFP